MTVQRAKKPHETYDLGYLRLYREDLEAIAGILQEECGNLLIEFHDEGQHTGNDPGDFVAVADLLPERLDKVTLTGKHGTTTFKVMLGGRSEIVVKDPDNSARGAAYAIRDLCQPRRMGLGYRLLRLYPLWLLPVGAGITALGIPGEALSGIAPTALIVGAAVTVTAATQTVAEFPTYGARTSIVNAPRASRPTHWQRHRIVYLSSTISLLIGGLIGYLVNQIPPWS